jgi:predicted RNase H-like nuclease (RuvC/YqgF family)
VQAGDEESDQQLKAGSKLHQHIVGIDPQGTGTKIGLVALDLPGHLGIEDDDTRQ